MHSHAARSQLRLVWVLWAYDSYRSRTKAFGNNTNHSTHTQTYTTVQLHNVGHKALCPLSSCMENYTNAYTLHFSTKPAPFQYKTSTLAPS